MTNQKLEVVSNKNSEELASLAGPNVTLIYLKSGSKMIIDGQSSTPDISSSFKQFCLTNKQTEFEFVINTSPSTIPVRLVINFADLSAIQLR